MPDLAGDCQSIVRFAEKVAKMVDVPGVFDHRHVYAIEDDPATPAFEPTIGMEVPNTHGGLNDDVRNHPTQPTWQLFLIDGAGGCNAFEAVAKFSACNTTRYYAGGTSGVFTNTDDVLLVFDSLSWTEFVGTVCTVRQNEHVYGAVPGNPPTPNCP